MFSKIITFIKEVLLELKKVNWPTKKEALNHTIIVIGISLAVAAFLGGLDLLFTTVFREYIIR